MLKKSFLGALCFTCGLVTFAWAQTQAELNQEARSGFEAADAELIKVYREFRANLSEEEKTRLKEVQLLWLKYRDANAGFEASLYAGGSMAGMVHGGAMTRATQDRVAALKGMFREGYPE